VDDGLGDELQVIWEIEPGARAIEKVALPEPTGFDPPHKLDAVRWGAASTAAYLLAAPAGPDEARQVAVKKAEACEEIPFATAKRMVAQGKKMRRPKRPQALPTEKLGLRTRNVLERYRERGNPEDLADFA
jgi:hypothetical protein